jgi:Na+/H+-dicarboxylate symporter/ABC-type amino acid transport substrate-binding protein
MLKISQSQNLPFQVLIAMGLGILFGIFFGEYASLLEPIGEAYVMLLQSVVYPYLISSLIYGLGRMDKELSLKFLKKGWAIYLGLIAISFCVIYLLVIDIPSPASRIINTNEPNGFKEFSEHIIQNIIPENPFTAVVNNAIPAVVVISILYGIAIQRFKNKETYLSFFETIMRASLQIWNWVIFLAPIGVFALLAYFSGTINFSNLEGVGIYLILFFIGSIFLTFVLLPTLISALSPLTVRETLRSLQSAFLISIVTTLSVAALPFIAEATRASLKRNAKGLSNELTEEIINPALSMSYPLCQLGNLFLLLFVFFSLFFFNRSISISLEFGLPILNYFSAIGSPSTSVNAIQFLSNSINLPVESTELYVALIPLTRYPQVMASVMGMAFFTILLSLNYFNLLKIRWHRLFLSVGYLAVFFICVLGVRKTAFSLLQSHHPNLLDFTIDSTLSKQVKATVVSSKEEATRLIKANHQRSTSLSDIQKRGTLIVGYNGNMIPWCYFNRNKQLVGYDVAFMYKLASDLRLELVFIPFEWYGLVNDIKSKAFDIAIGSIYVTADRLEEVAFTESYYSSVSSLIVKNKEVSLFYKLNDIANRNNLKIAVIEDPVTQSLAKLNFPNKDIVNVSNYDALPEHPEIDAALWTQGHTDAWVTVHPGYASLVPQGMIQGWPFMIAYMISKESPDLLEFLNYWLKLQDNQGFSSQQYSQWILRKPAQASNPRWCIARNVLHWID